MSIKGKYLNFNQMLFADHEPVTSYKLNSMINMQEVARTFNGPYSISLSSQLTATSFSVQMNEDASVIGGLDANYTNRKFMIYYETRDNDISDYACWEGVSFYNDVGTLVATLTSGENIYENAVDVSAINSDALFCVRCSG